MWSRSRRSAAAGAGAALLGLLVITAGAGDAADLVPPDRDPFYRTARPLTHLGYGTELRTRSVDVTSDVPGAGSATQILYRTENDAGQADATVATVIAPTVPGPVKLLSYQTFYDGVSAACRPSYDLRGGTAPSSTAQIDGALIATYLQAGYTVVTSDYEGPTDDYGAGRESGRATLDAITAAEHVLKLPASTPVGLVGYSGGAIASAWAGELQPTYAPHLHVVGIAAGGLPVDFAHNLAYIDGSADWAGAIPAVGVGLARAHHLRLGRFLSTKGRKVVAVAKQGCLDPTGDPGLTFASMLRGRFKHWQRTSPALVKVFNQTILGRRTPGAPVFLGVGNADGTGDGVMISRDVQQLAYEYCRRKLAVHFHVYSQSDHNATAPQFEADAQTFLAQAYAGVPTTDDCASTTPGNRLRPIPSPQHRHAGRHARTVVR